MTRRSPRLARWILERMLPADVREGISGDLEEMFRRRSRFWYWRQTASFSGRFLADRLRRRRISIGMSWLDFKLGLRMLRRYPGLTIVAGLGMARMFVKYPGLTIVAVIALSVSIGAGAAFMEFVADMVHPTLPYKDGGRIAGIVNWDAASNQANRRAMHDFLLWRGQVTSVVDLGATFSLQRNLITEDGRSETVKGAEISASAFRVIPAAPLLGRTLTDDDERQAAPPVAVIGETLWQSRFNGDPTVLGRTIRLGRAPYTIVGVMPRSFGFPMNHSLWVPLRAAPGGYARGQGPAIIVFGRLAPGAGYDRGRPS